MLDKITSATTTTGKVVDAPQDDQIEDLADNYLSGLTSTTTETSADTTTMMGRLDEIRRGYRNLYVQWYTEFKRRFVIITGETAHD